MKKDSARFILLLMFLSFVKESSGCCCTFLKDPCYCNLFGCNCHNPVKNDFCYFEKQCFDNYNWVYCEKSALDVFYHHDLNKVNINIYYIVRYISFQDGVISFEEMKNRNITIEDFNTVDMDQNGFIIPAELDDSLK